MLTEFGDWQRTESLGRGSYGEVTLWQNNVTRQKIAVKICPLYKNDALEKTEKIKERWINEIKIMKNEVASEQNIVRAVNVDEDFLKNLNKSIPSRLPALIMEYCDGGDLRKYLLDIKNSNGLIEFEVRNVMKALCRAIKYLHKKNIVHRDLKPENIVIQRNNDEKIYKITDFGYAKDMIGTNINSQVGTIGYFAPEVLCEGKYSPTVDFWSMGVITFEIICGLRPFVPHQTMRKWIELIRVKEIDTVAITENNQDNFEYHSEIFPENRISSEFRRKIEKWLKISLDFNHKRGLVTVNNMNGAPYEVQEDSFFNELHEILETKILTVFCLSTYTFLSYEITEHLTCQELSSKIAADLQVDAENLFIVPSPEQQIQEVCKPVNWVINTTEPMIYVVCVSDNLQNFGSLKPDVPKNIKDLISSRQVDGLKSFYLKDIARNMVYFRRNEGRHYAALQTGLKQYSLYLNHLIVQYEEKVLKFTSEKYQMIGAFSNFEALYKYSINKLEEKYIAHIYNDIAVKWESIIQATGKKVLTLFNTCPKIERRYKSILRRSKEVIESKFLQAENEDFFKLNDLEKFFETLKQKINDKKPTKCTSDLTEELQGLFYDTLEKRTKLLNNSDLFEIRQELSNIHVEFSKIPHVFETAFEQLQSSINEIYTVTSKQQDELCTVIENSAIEKYKKQQETVIPDLDSLMSSFKFDRNQNGAQTINFQLGPMSNPSTKMDVSCFGEGNDTKSLIVESDQIRTSLDHLMQDMDMTISTLRDTSED